MQTSTVSVERAAFASLGRVPRLSGTGTADGIGQERTKKRGKTKQIAGIHKGREGVTGSRECVVKRKLGGEKKRR